MEKANQNQSLAISRTAGRTGADAFAVMTQAVVRAADSAQLAARAQEALAKTTVSVTRALKNAVAGFDELHIAAQDEYKTRAEKIAAAKKATAEKKATGGGGSKRPSGGKGSGAALAQEEESAFAALLAAANAAAQEFAALLHSAYLPSILAWSAALEQVRAAAVGAFGSVRDSALALWNSALAPLAQYVLFDFLPQIVNGFSTVFAPIFADLTAMALEVFAGGFAVACEMVASTINTLLLPTLALIATVMTDVFMAVGAMWDAYGVPLMDGVRQAFEGVFLLLQSLYETVLLPVLAGVIEMLSALWTDTLLPLWQKLTLLFAEVGVMVLALWNNVLVPFGSFLVEKLGPIFVALGKTVADVFGAIARVVAGVVSGIVDVLRGLCNFLTGVFTGDWSRAWEGVKQIFSGVWTAMKSLLRGAVNAIIDMVNAMTRGVASAINAVVRAVNGIQVTIPAWVPVYGGQSFGASLPGVSAPEIPRLARGAVLPPNAEFLAVLGDQKNGRNLEAPEGLLRQIVREEGGARQTTVEQPIELALDGDVFYRAMARIRDERGVKLGSAFAHAY